jgi:hypothetical protein
MFYFTGPSARRPEIPKPATSGQLSGQITPTIGQNMGNLDGIDLASIRKGNSRAQRMGLLLLRQNHLPLLIKYQS